MFRILVEKTYTERLAADEVTTHTFYPWSGGNTPEWVQNKSGKVIISSALLRVILPLLSVP